MLCSLSKLDDSQLGQIESLEKELGKTLLSFTCHDIKPAELKGDELEKIKNLEKNLTRILISNGYTRAVCFKSSQIGGHNMWDGRAAKGLRGDF